MTDPARTRPVWVDETPQPPTFNSVNALTGERVESPVLKMLDAADEISGQAEELGRLRRDNEMLTRQADALCELSCRVQELEAENADLRDWRLRVADALGLAETVEGVGFAVIVNSAEEAAEYASAYTAVALAHERDCPVFCDEDEQYEMVRSCNHCNGSGCGPGTASGAYEECQWCAGDGRDHSTGYFSHACDSHANLTAERDDLADRLVGLKAAADHTLGLLADAKRELRTARAANEREAGH